MSQTVQCAPPSSSIATPPQESTHRQNSTEGSCPRSGGIPSGRFGHSGSHRQERLQEACFHLIKFKRERAHERKSLGTVMEAFEESFPGDACPGKDQGTWCWHFLSLRDGSVGAGKEVTLTMWRQRTKRERSNRFPKPGEESRTSRKGMRYKERCPGEACPSKGVGCSHFALLEIDSFVRAKDIDMRTILNFRSEPRAANRSGAAGPSHHTTSIHDDSYGTASDSSTNTDSVELRMMGLDLGGGEDAMEG